MKDRIEQFGKYSSDNWVCVGYGIEHGLTEIYGIPFEELRVWDRNPVWVEDYGHRGEMDKTLYVVSREYAQKMNWV